MRGRAWRRWQYQKKKKSRKHYWGGLVKDVSHSVYSPEKVLGMLASTPQSCSCFGGCGHMRDAYGPTNQERRAEDDAKLQEDEYVADDKE